MAWAPPPPAANGAVEYYFAAPPAAAPAPRHAIAFHGDRFEACLRPADARALPPWTPRATDLRLAPWSPRLTAESTGAYPRASASPSSSGSDSDDAAASRKRSRSILDCDARRSGSTGASGPKKRTPRVRERWTAAEHATFLAGLETFGKKWSLIKQSIPTKTITQVRTHANGHFAKALRASASRPDALSSAKTLLSLRVPWCR
jgi:hypothetical protein